MSSLERLPPELRLQIWEEALPRPFGPTLQLYEPLLGFGRISDSVKIDEDVIIESLLLSICRESRQVAQNWIYNEGIVLYSSHDLMSFCFKSSPTVKNKLARGICIAIGRRPFSPRVDALYLADCRIRDPLDRCFPANHDDFLMDMWGHEGRATRSNVEQLAVSTGLATNMARFDYNLFDHCPALRALLVVMHIQPDTSSSDDTSVWDIHFRTRIEFRTLLTVKCTWNEGAYSLSLKGIESMAKLRNNPAYIPLSNMFDTISISRRKFKNPPSELEFRAVVAVKRSA